MGKQSWQDMGEELLEEIKHLSFDFMKKSIHMSRTLDINPDLLLRFYTISDNSRMVLHVLGELARTANGRLVRRKKPARTAGVSPAASHIPPQSLRPSAGQHLLYTEITYDVAENRFAKAILLRLAKNLRDFVSEVDGFIGIWRRLPTATLSLIFTSSSGNGRISSTSYGDFSNSSKRSPRWAGRWRRACPSSGRTVATVSPRWSPAPSSA